MNKRQIKAFSEAYDKMYNLNSSYGLSFNHILEELENEVKKQNYEFKLSDKTQKFKLKMGQTK